MRMLGRARYIVSCCTWDDEGGKRHNKRKWRKAARKAEKARWERENRLDAQLKGGQK